MTYTVSYRLWQHDTEKSLTVTARSKAEAYQRAVYEAIPAAHGTTPYSAWIESVTYSNGNTRHFNTIEGKAY